MSLSYYDPFTEAFNASNISWILEASTYSKPNSWTTKWKETYFIIVCVLMIFGIFANMLGASVLSRLQKSNPGVRLLKFLAVIDITFLICDAIYIVYAYSYGLPKSYYVVLVGLLTLIYPFGKTCYTLEVYLTVLIACQRAVAVAKPLQASRYLRRPIINISIIAILVFSILLNIPFWLMFKRELYWDADLNITWISSEASEFYFSRDILVYDLFVISIFRAGVPLVILIICNTIIIVFSRRRTIQSTGRNNDQLIVMNIAIISMSVITHVATAVDRAFDYNIYCNMISEAVLVLNCSANFVFYCILGRSFRKALKDIFKSCYCSS